MSEIGHNGGPPLDAFTAIKISIEDLYELAQGALTGSEIKNDDQAEQIEQLKKDIKKAAAEAEISRKAEKQPHLDAGKAVDDKYKPVIERAKLAAKVAADALTPYLLAKQAERERIALEKQKEAERLAEEARKKFTESAPTDLDMRQEAEEAAQLAKKAMAVSNKIDREATGLRTYWMYEINDFRALLKWVMHNHPDDLKEFLNDYVKGLVNRGARDITGVNIYSERRAV